MPTSPTHLPPGVDPIRIPTGVMVQSMEFLSGDNVQVSGYVWQRYGPDVPGDLEHRGRARRRRSRRRTTPKRPIDTKRTASRRSAGISTATLRQPFEYAEFPFDEQDLWLRIWSRDIARRYRPRPRFRRRTMQRDPVDLAGNRVASSSTAAGLRSIPDSASPISRTTPHSASVMPASSRRSPSSTSTLILDRNFAGPFFEHLVFAIAVAFLLFGLLVLTTDDENLKAPLPAQHGGGARRREWSPLRGDSEAQPDSNRCWHAGSSATSRRSRSSSTGSSWSSS